MHNNLLCKRWLALLALAVIPALQAADTEELLVTASRTPRPALDQIGNTAALNREAVRLTSHQHI